MEWGDVIKLVGAKSKEIRARNPSMKQTDAMAAAWKDPAILKARAEYNAKKGTKPKAKPKPKAKSKAKAKRGGSQHRNVV